MKLTLYLLLLLQTQKYIVNKSPFPYFDTELKCFKKDEFEKRFPRKGYGHILCLPNKGLPDSGLNRDKQSEVKAYPQNSTFP